MHLMSLDFDPVYGEAERETFSGDRSVFDFDVVIWDPEASFDAYWKSRYGQTYNALPRLNDTNSVRIQADVARRRAEFADFINSGRTLIVIVRRPQQCYVDTGKRTYSGTGRNRHTTELLAAFDLFDALPDKNVSFTRALGDRIEIQGGGPIVDLLKKYSEHLLYEATISNPPGTSLACVTGTDKSVGSVFRSDKGGHLILLPMVLLEADPPEESDDDNGPHDPYISEAPEFQADLLAAVRDLSGTKEVVRPPWMEQYATDGQQKLRSKVAAQQLRVEEARTKLTQLQQKKEYLEEADQLFLGTGRTLELEVKKVLEMLGGIVTEPEIGRDDWRVAFPEGEAVVEVKGTTKGAAEKHAAQLEKWVSIALETTGKAPKGILIVNTWRNLPLDERKERSFPKQMLPYSTGRNHCLVSGIQLFVIRSEIEKNKVRARFWRRQIMNTAGTIGGCDDWRSILLKVTSEETSSAIAD